MLLTANSLKLSYCFVQIKSSAFQEYDQSLVTWACLTVCFVTIVTYLPQRDRTERQQSFDDYARVKDWTCERTCYVSFRPQGARFTDHLKADHVEIDYIVLCCQFSIIVSL